MATSTIDRDTLGWVRLGRIAFPRETDTERRSLIEAARHATLGMTEDQRAAFIVLAFLGTPVDVLAACTGERASALHRAMSATRARHRAWIADGATA